VSRTLSIAKALTGSTLAVATAGAGALGVHLYRAQHGGDDRAGSSAATATRAPSRSSSSSSSHRPSATSTSHSSRTATRTPTRSTATATTSTSKPVVRAPQPAQTSTKGS